MRRSEKLGMLTGLIVGTILLLISFLMGVKPVCKVWGSQTAYTASEAEKKYGLEMAEKIHQRIDEIAASDTVEEMVKFHIGRCHPLKGNRKGQYAMDLVHPYRLVFERKGNEIQIANVMEIVDYH